MKTSPVIPLASLLVLLALPLSLFSQDKSDSTIAPVLKNTMALTPLRLALPFFIGPEVTYQRKLSDVLCAQAKVGLIYSRSFRDPVELGDNGRLGLEMKAIYAGSFHQGTYVGLELDGGRIIRTESRTYATVTSSPDGSYSHGGQSTSDRFEVRKHYGGVNLKLGYQIIRGHFFMDLFAGIGIRMIQVSYDDISAETHADILESYGESFIAPLLADTPPRGTYFRPHVPMNVRVGFAF